MAPPRPLHAALYVPVLLIAAAQTFKAFYVLAHGALIGLYGLVYGAVLVWLARRALRAWRGELERPWLDAGVFALAAGLWGFLVVSQFL